MNTYIISVETSNIKQAGTDANVYIELIGRKDTSGRIVLNNSKTNLNKFEQGKTDVFEINCKDLGSLKKVIIGHDNKGFGPGWHLKQVVIDSKLDGRLWLCECNRWLDKKEDDGRIERELIPVEQPNYKPKQFSNEKPSFDNIFQEKTLPKKKIYFDDSECLYRISVSTSDLKYAGTDANVYIQIFGKKLETDKIMLKHSVKKKNLFEAGNTDVFEINTVDVGEIKKIKIGHDNKGIAAGWHLKEVLIEKQDNRKYLFPCDKWFDKKEDDGLIEREIYPLETILDKSDRVHNQIGSLVNYDIFVKTSDILNAGTDANVVIKIYGQFRKSEFIELKNSLTHRNKFEAGNTDRFNVKQEFFGELDKIIIKHDNSGIGPDWHLNEVVIESSELGRRWIFPCNRWLSKNEQTEIELRPIDNKMTVSNFNFKNYIIDVFTGDLHKAGTDANVFITLLGEENESPEKHLNDSKYHSNKFERNNVDRFDFECYDLGKLSAIRIRHDNTGVFPEWYLDRVEITDTSNNEKFIFNCRKWFAKNKDDCKIERIIEEINYKKKDRPININRPKVNIKKKKKRPSFKLENIKKSKPYYIKIYTGNKQKRTGTDLNASIKIFGDNEVSKEFKLNETKTHETKFFKDQIDLFEIETENDLGTIYAIELKFEQCLKNSNDLHLEKVLIVDQDITYNFEYNQLVSITNTDHGQTKFILLEKDAQFF